MTTLAEACADLRPLLPVAQALLAEPDAQGSAGHAEPASCPPWNAAAANAVYDAHAAIRELERHMRYEVTGTDTVRGGSDANTTAALDAIAAMGDAVTACTASGAARVLAYLADAILMLPAVDLEERPQRVRACCPYCQRPMLRLYPKSGTLTCLAYGSCSDSDGQHPRGKLGRSRLDGSAVIEWNDGLVS